jgi:hypothetical protein
MYRELMDIYDWVDWTGENNKMIKPTLGGIVCSEVE